MKRLSSFATTMTCIWALGALTGGCTLGSSRQPATAFAELQVNSPAFESATACNRWLDRARRNWKGQDTGFESPFVVAVWNAHKSQRRDWDQDLGALADRADILVLQEVAIRPAVREVIPQPFVAVSEGFYGKAGPTGLLSASHQRALASCTFIDNEPLLRSKKASSATLYPLSDKRETLLLVNVHSINFSLGLGSYSRQLRRLAIVMAGHQGPIILAGDLNIWNARREAFVQQLAQDLQLREVAFSPDHRTRVLGYPLDRIFWRDLALLEAGTETFRSSDHNPMIATWSLASTTNPQ